MFGLMTLGDGGGGTWGGTDSGGGSIGTWGGGGTVSGGTSSGSTSSGGSIAYVAPGSVAPGTQLGDGVYTPLDYPPTRFLNQHETLNSAPGGINQNDLLKYALIAGLILLVFK